ncbi:MAG: DNA polymerase III subunit delta' [Terriglobia bacterium]
MGVTEETSLWGRVHGQNEAVSFLKGAVTGETVSHAYLFAGPPSVGKRTAALVMAAALNCERSGAACGECLDCRKAERMAHPNIQLIEPSGAVISIDQVREVQSGLQLKSVEGRTKVVVLDEIDRTTPPAANALLRVLEEPPADVVFILVSSRLETVMPTIVSRCQLVRFRTLSEEELVEVLREDLKLDQDEARLVTRITGGQYGKTLKWAQFPERFLRRERVLKIARDLPEFDLYRTITEAESLTEEVRSIVGRSKQRREDELKAVEKNDSLSAAARRAIELRNRREVAQEEEQIYIEIFSVFASFYRDTVVLAETGREEYLVNVDRIDLLGWVAGSRRKGSGLKALAILEKSEELLRLNVNKPLIIEWMLLRLKELS